MLEEPLWAVVFEKDVWEAPVDTRTVWRVVVGMRPESYTAAATLLMLEAIRDDFSCIQGLGNLR